MFLFVFLLGRFKVAPRTFLQLPRPRPGPALVHPSWRDLHEERGSPRKISTGNFKAKNAMFGMQCYQCNGWYSLFHCFNVDIVHLEKFQLVTFKQRIILKQRIIFKQRIVFKRRIFGMQCFHCYVWGAMFHCFNVDIVHLEKFQLVTLN